MSFRESLFPSRRETTAFGSSAAKQSESVRRQSSAAPLGSRRNTTLGSLGATKTDPRPTRNADFVRSCAAKLEEFVRKIGPKDVLSPKAFVSPTSRDFAVLWETVLNALDARWCKKLKGKKLEEQVPAVLKGLGYALSVSKSALGAPGSTHSWPQIVLALDWMVDIVEFKHKHDRDGPVGEDAMEVEGSEEVLGLNVGVLFDWMTRSYEKYMSFDDAAVRDIDQSFLVGIEEREKRQKLENEQTQQEVEAAIAELKKAQQMPSPLVQMKTELNAMQQDEASLKGKIKHIEELLCRLNKKTAELETEIQTRSDQIRKISGECEELRMRVSKQSVNKEDIAQLLNEKQKLRQMLDNAKSHKAAIEAEVNNREVHRDELLNELEKCIHSYHNLARKLKLIPKAGKHADGIDFSIGLDRNVADFHAICTADQRGVVQPGLMQIESQYQSKKAEREGHVLQLQQRYVRLQEEIQKLQLQRSNCRLETQKMEHEIQRYREAIQTVKQGGAEEYQATANAIAELLRRREEEVRFIEHRGPEAEASFQEVARICEKEREALMKELSRATQNLSCVRSSVDALLDEWDGQTERAIESAGHLMNTKD